MDPSQMAPGMGMDAAGGGIPPPPAVGGVPINPLVLKEPRGMIRILQVIFAILAFATTTSFDTKSTLQVACPSRGKGAVEKAESAATSKIVYPIEYPFKFHDAEIFERYNCSRNMPMIQQKFPMDFSSSAQFFVATGVLAFLYAGAAIGLYMTKSIQYATNPLLPVIDLAVTALLALFWVAGSCAWALGVSDLRYYTHPRYLREHIYVCNDRSADCSPLDTGNWATLNISLLCGFTSAFLWCMSCWFVFKETTFHQKGPQPVGGFPAFDPQQQQQAGFPAHMQQQPFPAPQQGFTAQY